jgi:hypothetical protein
MISYSSGSADGFELATEIALAAMSIILPAPKLSTAQVLMGNDYEDVTLNPAATWYSLNWPHLQIEDAMHQIAAVGWDVVKPAELSVPAGLIFEVESISRTYYSIDRMHVTFECMGRLYSPRVMKGAHRSGESTPSQTMTGLINDPLLPACC